MAGKYIEFVNPGYSTLYTRDLSYKAATATTALASDPANPFDPDSANPLVEGEWLQIDNDNKCSRLLTACVLGSQAAAAEKNGYSTIPCVMHFSEKGRYDAQITKKAHMVTGPVGFEFRCKLCVATSSAVTAGQRVVVGFVSVGGKMKRGLVAVNASDAVLTTAANTGSSVGDVVWSPGYISRVHGDNDIVVTFQPSYIRVES